MKLSHPNNSAFDVFVLTTLAALALLLASIGAQHDTARFMVTPVVVTPAVPAPVSKDESTWDDECEGANCTDAEPPAKPKPYYRGPL